MYTFSLYLSRELNINYCVEIHINICHRRRSIYLDPSFLILFKNT